MLRLDVVVLQEEIQVQLRGLRRRGPGQVLQVQVRRRLRRHVCRSLRVNVRRLRVPRLVVRGLDVLVLQESQVQLRGLRRRGPGQVLQVQVRR